MGGIPIRKVALGWATPLLEAVTDRLCSYVPENGFAELGRALVIVPTQEAGRLLRESMAERFSARGGLLSFRVELPPALLRSSVRTAPEALQWINFLKILHDIPTNSCRNLLFGLETFQNNERRLLGIAAKLRTCRETLAAEGLSLADVCERFDALCREEGGEERWEQLERFREFRMLEQRYLDCFPEDLPEPISEQLRRMRDPVLPPGVDTLIFAGCPAPLPCAMFAAEFLAEKGVVVETWIAADEDDLIYFDAWGRPVTGYWENQKLDLDCENVVRRFANPDAEARKILNGLENPSFRPSGIGILDPEILQCVQNRQTSHAGRIPLLYAPEQRKLTELPLTGLYLELLTLTEENLPFEAAASLARNPFILNYCEKNGILRGGAGELLKSLDLLQTEHVLYEFEALERVVENSSYEEHRRALPFVKLLSEWRASLMMSKDAARVAFTLLSSICGDETACPELSPGIASTELRELGRIVGETIQAAPGRSRTQVILIRTQLEKMTIFTEPEVDATVDLVGFLELPWRNDPELLIAGMNEEMFGYTNGADSFLPDRIRTLLGMTDGKFAYALDVYRFRQLLELRIRNGGRISVLYAKSSSNGDLLHPARLLLQCADNELPERARMLFSGMLDETESAEVAEKTLFLYRPHVKKPGERMSITSFRSYLACPFRFYMDFVLHGDELDDRNVELDFMQFGDLVHQVLERFGRNAANADTPEKIEAFCMESLEYLAFRRFLHPNRGALKLQLEIMRNHFVYLAKAQANEYENGWRIHLAEYKMSFSWQTLFEAFFPGEPLESWRSSITLRAKVDRVDRNELTGKWRVLDYKTNRSSKTPREAHCSSSARCAEDWRFAFHDGKKNYYWTDLQLPLYVAALSAGLIDTVKPDSLDSVSAGYFNLPLAYTETEVKAFPELESPEVMQRALLCADSVLRRIFVEHRFDQIKPVENPAFDKLTRIIGDFSESDFDFSLLRATEGGV